MVWFEIMLENIQETLILLQINFWVQKVEFLQKEVWHHWDL